MSIQPTRNRGTTICTLLLLSLNRFSSNWSQSRGRPEMTKGGTKCRLWKEEELWCSIDQLEEGEGAPDGAQVKSHDSAGYTYPATYKVCTVSASCGRPNPHTVLHR